ncbi:MAG: hypothetical protein ACKPDM_18600, partial [Dolichospermum sp.]
TTSVNNKKWRNTGLYALLFIVVIALGTAFFDKQPQNRETWRYSQFIHFLLFTDVVSPVLVCCLYVASLRKRTL